MSAVVAAGGQPLVVGGAVRDLLLGQRLTWQTTIRARLAASGRTLAYEHRRAYEEPLLWAADAMAWCYGAGGEWRRRIAPTLDKAVRLDP